MIAGTIVKYDEEHIQKYLGDKIFQDGMLMGCWEVIKSPYFNSGIVYYAGVPTEYDEGFVVNEDRVEPMSGGGAQSPEDSSTAGN
jgi:hypothetical protein